VRPAGDTGGSGADGPRRSPDRRPLREAGMRFRLFSVGLITLLGQVVLLRELLVAFFGSELIYILALGFLLPGTALGVFAGARLRGDASVRVRVLLLAFAGLLPLCICFIRALRVLFGATPGAYLPFALQIAGMAAAMIPFGILSGLLFQRSASLYVSRGRTLAHAYAVESAGGLAGGVLVTLFLAWGVQNLAAGLACALYAAAASAVPWRRNRPVWLAPLAGAAAVLLIAGMAVSGRLDRLLTGLNHPSLVATLDTPYGRVTLTRLEGQVSVFENDALAFESQGTEMEAFVHMAALQVEAPRSVLILGGGPEGIVREVLRHGPGRVDDVELNEAAVRLLLGYLPGQLRDALRDERVTLVYGDPRTFLRRRNTYDLILVGMPEPESGQNNRFYTREFFEACRGRLGEDGVLGFRLGSAENLWTPALTRRTASITEALRAVFGDVLVLPGTTNVVLASNGRLQRDPGVLSARLLKRKIESRLVTPRYVRYILTNDRLAAIEAALRSADVPVNTDARPICYQYTLVLWLSRFFPALGLTDFGGPEGPGGAGGRPWLFAAAGAVLALVVALRWWVTARRILLVILAGFVGMVLEGVLILGFQVRSGVLYQDIGVLLAVFMAGLSLGSLFVDQWGSRTRHPKGIGVGAGAVVAGGMAVLALVVAGLFRGGLWPGLAGASLLMGAAGFFVGGLFAYASLRRVDDQNAIIAPLYAADLMGGCAGSLLGSLFLLPVLGLPASALLVAALSLAALLLI